MKKEIKHIVHFPRWYPSELDPQNGVFIEKHIRCISEIAKSSVIFVVGRKKQEKWLDIKSSQEENTHTFVCYFRKYTLLAPFQYFICFYILWRKVTAMNGYPQVLHAHVGLRTVVLARIIGALHNIPFIISEHWSGFVLGEYERRYYLYRFILRRVYRKASAVSVVSEKLKNAMLDLRLIKSENTFIIPNVISKLLTKRKLVKNDVVKIIVVADLRDHIKNVSGILRVISKVNTKPYELTIIGGGPDEQMLKDLADSLDFGKNKVTFTGVQNNGNVFYSLYHSDFLISNSRFETFGMVPIEALACGTPIVCCFEACPEEIHRPEYGFFVGKDDEEALKRSIIMMLEGYQEFDSELLRRAATNFYPEVVTDKFVEMYNFINN